MSMSTEPKHPRCFESRSSRPKESGDEDRCCGTEKSESIVASVASFGSNGKGESSDPVSPSISSCHPAPGNCVVLESLPVPPLIDDASTRLNQANFERCAVPKRLRNQTKHHLKCREAFILERTRAESAISEAKLQEYVKKSNLFMIKQQENLETQSAQVTQLTTINNQLTAEATALKAEVQDLKDKLNNNERKNNAELEVKVSELTTQLNDTKKKYRLQLEALLYVVRLEMKGS